jgi:hypothetical protein
VPARLGKLRPRVVSVAPRIVKLAGPHFELLLQLDQ